MFICYLDESGGFEAPDAHPSATPVMVLLGLIVDIQYIRPLTEDFLAVKRRHFPGKFLAGHVLDDILVEAKGSDVLRQTRSGSRDRRRQADLLRADILALLADYQICLVGRVWVKSGSKSLARTATYCYAVQDICRHFSHYVTGSGSSGVVVADSRLPNLDSGVAHSVFTQKWRAAGDPYPGLGDVPFFANSVHHVGLQLSDLVASSLVFPMACAAYGDCPQSVHSSKYYADVRANFGTAVKDLQYRYEDDGGRWRGGIVVSDRWRKRSGSLLFEA